MTRFGAKGLRYICLSPFGLFKSHKSEKYLSLKEGYYDQSYMDKR